MNITAREAALEAIVRCRRDEAWSGASIDNVINKDENNKSLGLIPFIFYK